MKKWISSVFKDELKNSNGNKLGKDKIKKNWLGMTKVYDCYSSHNKWFSIGIESHVEEDNNLNNGNLLTIAVGHRGRCWVLPFKIIKPVVDYHRYDDGKIIFTKYCDKIYGFILDVEKWEYVDMLIGKTEKLTVNINNHKDRTKHINLFWNYCIRTSYDILHLNKMFYCNGYNNVSEYKPNIKFLFLDYNDNDIIATATLDRSIYRYGTGFITRKIMSFFKRPIVTYNMVLKFNKKAALNKNMFGKTESISLDIDYNEEPTERFKRFCNESITKVNDKEVSLRYIKKI